MTTTTEQHAQLKDHILDLFANYKHNANEDNFTVFIDSLSQTYPEADTLGSSTSSTSAPFANKTPYECSLLLGRCVKKTRKIASMTVFSLL